MDLYESKNCNVCEEGHFFEDHECKRCDKRFDYCHQCNAEECMDCIDQFILKEDGLCWEDHCDEYLGEFRDECVSCRLEEDGTQWLLDEDRGSCVDQCDPLH